jgi:hypothetical protein
MKSELKNNPAFSAIQLISGRPTEELAEMLENIGIYAMLSHVKNKKIVIPYIGSLVIHREEANLKCQFSPSPFLTRNIGQIKNGEQADFENILAKKFKDVTMPKRELRKYEKKTKTIMVKEAQEGLF